MECLVQDTPFTPAEAWRRANLRFAPVFDGRR